MPKKSVINVKCPCCDAILEVDVEKERVLSHRRGRHLMDDARSGEDAFGVAIRNQREARERADRQFDQARDALGSESSRLDELFRDAQRKVAEERDEDDD